MSSSGKLNSDPPHSAGKNQWINKWMANEALKLMANNYHIMVNFNKDEVNSERKKEKAGT